MLVRLLGVPVVVMAMPGDRIDAPHDLVYRAADHIVAAWPQDLYEPPWLQGHSAKTTYVGGISRFDGRAPDPSPPDRRANVLVLNGAGGSSVDATFVKQCAAAHPQFRWTALGVAGGPWAQDPWPALCAADVVISSAGQSSVADIAAAGRPAIVIAAARPFAEQHATARALDRGRLAVVQHGWPEPGRLAIARSIGHAGAIPRGGSCWADAGCGGPRRRGDRPRRVDLCNDERIVKTAVVTAVHGRTAHLRKQLEGLARGRRPGGPPRGGGDRRRRRRPDGTSAGVCDTRSSPSAPRRRRLPVGAARNLGAQTAIDEGAELLIFLDVDCIPAPNMVGTLPACGRAPRSRRCASLRARDIPAAGRSRWIRPCAARSVGRPSSGEARAGGRRHPGQYRVRTVLVVVIRRVDVGLASDRRVLLPVQRLRRRGHRLRAEGGRRRRHHAMGRRRRMPSTNSTRSPSHRPSTFTTS